MFLLEFHLLIIVFLKAFQSNLNANGYMQILTEELIPFILNKFGNDAVLVQDNSRIHTARKCKRVLEISEINWISIL